MPNRHIHVARDNEELGTFTPDEVNELLAGRFLKPADRYWMPGMADWQPIGEVFKVAESVPATSAWLTSVRRQFVERSADVVARVGGLVQTVKTGTTGATQSLSQTRQKILEEQLPSLQKLLAVQLKDKPLTAARSALQNDDLMRKAFGALYDCLPRPVCRFIGEDAFVRFCLPHRERLIKSPAQADQQTDQVGSPPANET
jgi:GYF domain 2